MPTTKLSELSKIQQACDDNDPSAMSVEQARKFIRAFLQPITQTESVSLREALGRVNAKAIISPFNVPDFDNSAMDGYAFCYQEIADTKNATCPVVGTALAGKPYTGGHQTGSCVRIMTGAVLPVGTNTVIPQERVSVDGNQVRFSTDIVALGANVRRAGEDIAQHQLVFSEGHTFRPADIGLLASLGIAQVSVYRKLKVAFFSTGDELMDISQPLSTGKIYDSNRYTLYAMLQGLNLQIEDLGAVADNPLALEATLLKASQYHDVVITSGGVSVGEADYMKQLLEKNGEVLFWKISMKPGRPLAYGKVANAHYFGLPGNPVAVMVTFYQFVQDALKVLMGQHQTDINPTFQVTLASPIKKAKGRMEFQRGILFQTEQGDWQVKSTGNQSSGVLSSMSQANCLIILDEECGSVDVGEKVRVQLLRGLS